MEDNSGNNEGYKSIILKKTTSLFGLIGYFLGNQEYAKPEATKKRKDKKKLEKENDQIYGMLKAGISMMANKISSLNRGFGFLKSLSDLILSGDVILPTEMSKGNLLSIENQENIDLIMVNLHQINQAHGQNMLYQFADSFQSNPDVLKGQDSLVNTLELEQKFDCLVKLSNHGTYTSEPGILHEILLPQENDTISSVLSDHTIEPIELMQKVIESNLLLDEMLAERNSQYSNISPYELIPQESYYSNDDINDGKIYLKKGKTRSSRRRTLTGEGKNEPSFVLNDKNIGCEKFLPEQNQLTPSNENIQCQQNREEINVHGNSKDLQQCESENFNIRLSIKYNSIDCKASNSKTFDTESNKGNEILTEVETSLNQFLAVKTKNDYSSAQLCVREETQSPTKFPSITYTDTDKNTPVESSIEFRIGSKVLQLISNKPMDDQYDFQPTVLYIEKVISCVKESTTSDGDNNNLVQSENLINLDKEFCLKFSKMTTDNRFKFFVWS